MCSKLAEYKTLIGEREYIFCSDHLGRHKGSKFIPLSNEDRKNRRKCMDGAEVKIVK